MVDSKKELLTYLDERAIDSKIYLAEDATETTDADLWLAHNYPFSWWGRIDWQKVSNSAKRLWSSYTDVVEIFQQLVIEQQLEDTEVFITWDGQLVLEIQLSELLEADEKLFQMAWDTWIFSPQHGWCIECYHEGELCFGYSPIQALN